MRRPRAVRVAAGAVLVGLAALAGCTGGDDEGPDETVTASDDTRGQGVRARCVVADPEGEVILHPGSFTAPERMRLGSAALEEPENLAVVEASVVDYRGPEDLQGVVLDYPPVENTSFVDALADWEARRPLTGLRVRPQDGQQAVLIAVRLEDPGKPGHVRGVTIESRTHSGPRTMGWEQLVLVLPDGEVCTVEVVAETTEWTG